MQERDILLMGSKSCENVKFKYLCAVTYQHSILKEINGRLHLENASYHSVWNLFSHLFARTLRLTCKETILFVWV